VNDILSSDTYSDGVSYGAYDSISSTNELINLRQQVQDKLPKDKKSKKSKHGGHEEEELKRIQDDYKARQHGYTHAYIQEDLSEPQWNPQKDRPLLPLHPTAAMHDHDEDAPHHDMKTYSTVPHGYRHISPPDHHHYEHTW
jgi:hypothetical protein